MNRTDFVQFLRQALPPSDILSTPGDILGGFADHTLMLLEKTPWLAGVPEDLLLSYVLIPRINKEKLETHRQELFQELWPRIQNQSMRDAVLEVNYWCFEKATYRSTDGRTASALTVIRSAYGRCGEESTLLSCALRAVGIPARQVYVPRWAHCNDNHAWVEAWVDGEWYYLGACEPEPTLDNGWFTAAASRSMLIHTQAYGLCPRGEEEIARHQNLYTLNRTANYADTAALEITLLNQGAPLADAVVCFELVNEAELFPLCKKTTDEHGQVALTVGLGGLHLHISYQDAVKTLVLDTRKQTQYEFDVSELACVESFALHAPVETRMDESVHTQAHREKMTECEQKRVAFERTFDTSNAFLSKARGNHTVIRTFLEDSRYPESEKQALLSTLSEKDFTDITLPVLDDAMAAPANSGYPADVYLEAVLCPRAEREALWPVRRGLQEYFKAHSFNGAEEIFTWVEDNIADNGCPEARIVTPADPLAALQSRRTDSRSRRLLAISICRALGFPVKISPLTGLCEMYINGGFVPVDPQRKATSTLQLTAQGNLFPVTHFSLSRLQGTFFHTINLPRDCAVNASKLPLPPGTYRVLTMARRIDGSTHTEVRMLTLEKEKTCTCELTMPTVSYKKLLYSVPMPDCGLYIGGKPAAIADTMQNGGIVALIALHQEPSYHLLNETIENKKRIIRDGRKVLLIAETQDMMDDPVLKQVLEELDGSAVVAECNDLKPFHALRSKLRAGDLRLPLTIAVNSRNQALFAFTNYQVGTVEAILNILND